jgi:hypothetical protein
MAEGPKQHLQDGNRERLITIACVCADGTSLSPGLVINLQQTNYKIPGFKTSNMRTTTASLPPQLLDGPMMR